MTKLLFLLAALAGCDSLVDGPCADGYERTGAACSARQVAETDAGTDSMTVADAMLDGSVDAMPDGGVDAMPDGGGDAMPDGGIDAPPDAIVDAAPDAPSCAPPAEMCDGTCKDLSADPDNCGTCDRVCASGICANGHCEGEPWGHIVAIGHDYSSHHASQRRVLANAVALGAMHDVRVAWWPGEAPSMVHTGALATAMTAINRPWHPVAFPATPASSFAGVDVILVAPEHGGGDAIEAMASGWAAAFDTFLRGGGVIVVLDGAGGQNHRFAAGAGLFVVDAPISVTGQPTAVVDPSDALVEHVVAPYLAEASSVIWPNATEPVVTTMGGTGTIVFHLTR